MKMKNEPSFYKTKAAMGEKEKFKREIFIPFLQALVDKEERSMRQISLSCGMDHGAVRRYLKKGSRPGRDACIAMAHYFGRHPNEFLEKAGYMPLAYFDLSLADPDEFPPDVKKVAQELMKIEDGAVRQRVSDAVLKLVKEMFTESAE